MPADDDIPFVDRRQLRWKTSLPHVLGQGSFGIVYRGTLHGTPCAIKVVRPSRTSAHHDHDSIVAESAAMRQHRREVHRLSVVRNPYIIQYLGVFRGEHPRDIFIVTELLEGKSLHESMSSMRARDAVLEERSFLQIAMHMAYGLNYIHAQQYTHGDMKPQNVLLTAPLRFLDAPDGRKVAHLPESAKVKIADLGLSRRLEGAETYAVVDASAATGEFGTGPCGTYLYMAPEAYGGVSRLSDADAKAADVYAYGLILFELLSGLVSWGLENVRNAVQLHCHVIEGRRPAWGSREGLIRREFIDLVQQCWSQKAEARPTAEEIVTILHRLDGAEEEEEEEEGRGGGEKVSLSASPAVVVKSRGAERRGGVASPRSPRRPRKVVVPPAPLARSYNETESSSEDIYRRNEDGYGGGENESDLGSSSEGMDVGVGATIVAVESMRRLTASQEEKYANVIRGDHLREDEAHLTGLVADDVVELPNAHIANGDDREQSERGGDANTEELSSSGARNRSEAKDDAGKEEDSSLVVEPEGIELPGVAEIDQSMVGGVVVTRVQSMQITVPPIEPLQIISQVASKPTMGMGSVAELSGLPGGSRPRHERSDGELFVSFLDAEVMEQKFDGVTTNSQHRPSQDGSTITQPSNVEDLYARKTPLLLSEIIPSIGMSPVCAEPSKGIFIGSNPRPGAQSGGGQMGFGAGKVSDALVGYPGSMSSATKSYSSPYDVDEVSLSVLNAEDSQSWPSYQHVMTSPNRPGTHSSILQAGKASHPPSFPPSVLPGRPVQSRGRVFYGNSQVVNNGIPPSSRYQYRNSPVPGNTHKRWSGMPTPHTPASVPMQPAGGYNYGGHATPQPCQSPWAQRGPLRANVDGSSVSNSLGNTPPPTPQIDTTTIHLALKGPDVERHLRNLWAREYQPTVAAGLASAKDLVGKNLLLVACDFLKENNAGMGGRQSLAISRDLAITIGNIARRQCSNIGLDVVEPALRVTLMTMFKYGSQFQRNSPAGVMVFSSCNFALCNLFKVSNRIPDVDLRTRLAAWIAFSISWNVFEDSENPGPKADTLSYTATSAARNFMWMNEDNVVAFTSQTPGEREPATSCLISSMKFFDFTGSFPVLEASLSALATIVHFPRQRLEFTQRLGVRSLLEVINHHANHPKVVGLVFSMIMVLFSGPVLNGEEAQNLGLAFEQNNGCSGLISAVELVHRKVQGERDLLDVLEKGCGALLAPARFCSQLRPVLVRNGCATVALKIMQWLASVLGLGGGEVDATGGLAEARVKLGVTVCQLVRELGKEARALSFLKEQGMAVPLDAMLKVNGCDGALAVSCRAALATIV